MFAVVAGCFSIPLKNPTRVTQQVERGATIRLGESTSADVRAALGETLLESNFWRVELYRVEDTYSEVGIGWFGVLPFHVTLQGYVLVSYDAAGRVSQVSSGHHEVGFQAQNQLMMIRADELTFAHSPIVGNVLLADSSRLPDYLTARSKVANCTLVVACAQEEGCPGEITIDDGEPFDPSPITVLCAPDASCPKGSRVGYGTGLFTVPVLHAITVRPGKHRLLITSSLHDGRGEASFECTASKVLYGIIRSRVEGASWWSGRGKLQVTATLSTVALEDWGARSIVLYREGRWLVEPEPDR